MILVIYLIEAEVREIYVTKPDYPLASLVFKVDVLERNVPRQR